MRYRSLGVLYQLFKWIKLLLWIIILTILFGTLGFVSSISLTVLGSLAIVKILGTSLSISFNLIIILLLSAGFLRGVFRYIEHYTGHYVAFRLLAILRDKIFKQLRTLTPAKLDQKEKGRIISMISSDVETLEVFYAHTIAPIAIAFNISLAMIIIISIASSFLLGLIALITSVVMGIVLPIVFSKHLQKATNSYREQFNGYSQFLLDSILGIKDLTLLNATNKRTIQFLKESAKMEVAFKSYKNKLAFQQIITDFLLYFFVLVMLGFASVLYYADINNDFVLMGLNIKNTFGSINLLGLILAVIGLLTSFGPLLALINLPTSLNFSINSGRRLLKLLDEKPQTPEIVNGTNFDYKNLSIKDLSFSYDENVIFNKFSLDLKENGIIGIYGDSGSGKSTLLKLIMRFYDTTSGTLTFNDNLNIKDVNSKSLYNNIGYIMQETHIFNDTLTYNLSFRDNLKENLYVNALKKTGLDEMLHDQNEILQKSGRILSQGERQRLGLSRIFLHNKPLILLDEPTSNIDVLNEAIILKTLKDAAKSHKIILVTHKQSTLSICDKIYELKDHELILKS